MKPKILGTKQPRLIEQRFRVMLAMLEGKQDISTGRDGLDICADVDLSPASVRNFLNKPCELGYANTDFIPMGHNPIGLGWPSHNEYSLSDEGHGYIADQLSIWETESDHDAKLVKALRHQLEKS